MDKKTDLEKGAEVVRLMRRMEELNKGGAMERYEHQANTAKALADAQGALIGVGATVYVRQFLEERAHTVLTVATDGYGRFCVTTTPDCFAVTPGAEDLIRWQPNDMAPARSWDHAEIQGDAVVLFPKDSKPGERRTCDKLVIGYRSIRYEGRPY